MELPNTKIRSVLPDTAQQGTPVNIVEAWSGGAVDASAQGTFGRWGYIPQYSVIALVNGIDQNAWVFRVSR